MKKFILFIIIIFAGLFLGGYYLIKPQEESDIINIVNKKDNEKEIQHYEFEGTNIVATWFSVNDASNIKLYPNYKDQITSSEAREKYSCISLVSGGFYDENNSPIGLFVSEGEMLSKQVNNSTFNGYFSVDDDGNAKITSWVPNDVRIGLQTGPLLVYEGNLQNLKLARDKEARRVVLAQSETDKLYFIVIYDSESFYQGPKLDELPEMIKEIEDQIGERITEAINLDGGAASSFYTKDFGLTELSFVGSFFCMK